jgi:hypothetical protein
MTSSGSANEASSASGWRAVLAIALPLTIFLIGMRYVGSGDTEPAELLPISLLTEGNLDFNEFKSSGDLLYAYVRIGGRVVSSYPIMAGLLNVPVYAIARPRRGSVRTTLPPFDDYGEPDLCSLGLLSLSRARAVMWFSP